MKGIYLTEEGKKEIEAKIAEIEKDEDEYSECCGIATTIYQQIISSATILPVEDNWDEIGNPEQIKLIKEYENRISELKEGMELEVEFETVYKIIRYNRFIRNW